MSRLFLLRHARAAWAEPGMRDFDRPLEPSGLDDADAAGAIMLAEGLVPARVLCSGARRTRQTWEQVARHLRSVADVTYTDSLYASDATGYVTAICEAGSEEPLLIVGHNPMIEDVCFGLAPKGDARATEARASGFPAGALAVISFDGPLSAAAPGRGRLEAFYGPADL